MNKRDNDLGFCSMVQNLLTLVYCPMTCETNKAMQDTCISILVASAYVQTFKNLRCSRDLRGDVDEGNDNYDIKDNIFIKKKSSYYVFAITFLCSILAK